MILVPCWSSTIRRHGGGEGAVYRLERRLRGAQSAQVHSTRLADGIGQFLSLAAGRTRADERAQLTVLATRNAHKVLEFREILAPLGFDVVTISELAPEAPDVDEVGNTFLDNAVLKAAAAWQLTGRLRQMTVGYASMPWAERRACIAPAGRRRREANNQKLLTELEGVGDEEDSALHVCHRLCHVSGQPMFLHLWHWTHRYLPDGQYLWKQRVGCTGAFSMHATAVEASATTRYFWKPRPCRGTAETCNQPSELHSACYVTA